jgi:uncharacterized membrane protein YphA (DoxX/SURF4 family)
MMRIKANGFLFLRLCLGGILIVSATKKLLSPVEIFIYTIQSYEVIYHFDLIELMALILPWGELFIGVFLLLGLWTKLALFGSGLLAGGFIILVGQAITRGLTSLDCGCLGDVFHWSLRVSFALEWTILMLSILLYLKIKETNQFSLDHKLD